MTEGNQKSGGAPSKALSVNTPTAGPMDIFTNMEAFETGQRMANLLSSSKMVPNEYQGKENMGNALIALDIAHRTGASPVAVMQNLVVIHGRPSWSAQFIISAINASGLFSPIRYRMGVDGDVKLSQAESSKKISNKTCLVYVNDITTGEILEGPTVSMAMAIDEGWYGKKGSKWQTMPELMLRYRAAAFFGRLYAPHILMGMQTQEEVLDVGELKDISPSVVMPRAETMTDEASHSLASDAVNLHQPAKVEEERPAKQRRATKADKVAAFENGKEAATNGAPRNAAPEGSPAIRASWLEGWQDMTDVIIARKAEPTSTEDSNVPFDMAGDGEAVEGVVEGVVEDVIEGDEDSAPSLPKPSNDFSFGGE